MKESIKKYLDEFKIGTKIMFKEFFNKETNKKQRANMWTFSRLIISILILILSIMTIISFSAPILIASGSLVALGAVTDYFDGKSARKHNSASEYGKKLDQMVDKVFSIIVGTSLAVINPLYIIPLVGECTIVASNIPFCIKKKKLDNSSLMIGKIKQWPLGLAFFLGYLSPLTNWLNITAMITIIVTYILQNVTALSYLDKNINEIVKLKKVEKNNNLLEIEEEQNNEKELNKTLEEKNNFNNNIEKNKNEQVKELKEFKNELIYVEGNNNINYSFQKTKKF